MYSFRNTARTMRTIFPHQNIDKSKKCTIYYLGHKSIYAVCILLNFISIIGYKCEMKFLKGYSVAPSTTGVPLANTAECGSSCLGSADCDVAVYTQGSCYKYPRIHTPVEKMGSTYIHKTCPGENGSKSRLTLFSLLFKI